MNKKRLWLGLAALVAVGAVAFWHFGKTAEAPGQPGGGRRGFGGDRPLPVQAAAVKSGDIDVAINALGTVTARNTATVKARVDGQLTRLPLREGALVKQGDLLAEIDPRPFQVLFDQARGQLVRDEALLANAKLDYQRYAGLLAKDSIAKQQVDAQAALVRQDEGIVLTDRAQVDSAKLQLDFTRVTAPVPGRLGLRQVDAGNMVHASDATGIVVITQTQPISVVFAIPADSLAPVLMRLRAGETLAVEAFDRDGKTRLATGKVLTVDNQIDVSTGTVKLKAEFANADNALFPNQFVNARLRVETRHGAALMPVAAIQRGTQGTFVYVVGAEQKVAIRPVTLGPTSGEVVAVEKGVAPGDLVITDGADKLRDGAKVEVTTPASGVAPAKDPRGGAPGGSPDERQKRWAELNARIDRGEFGEEMKKLPEEQRKQRMREMRRQGGGQ
ncbi:MAG: MdtA/MuxA family multidrug efflux RND transporter periplasmic adaptor subunit [Rhodocyclaceae bacterium]|nr:MdtA/MuxA family multidrug efflux RND transporter periplasmic adaptor subunit [Rhodocyclaceae bacterium]